MSSEAWKDTGDCAECRRKDYCRKTCSASKRSMERIVKMHFIHSAVTGRIYPKLAHLAEEKQDD